MVSQRVVINIGCGQTPTKGALNFDNSPSVLLSNHKMMSHLLSFFLGFSEDQRSYIQFCKENRIQYCNASKIPVPDGSVDVVYTSQVLDLLTDTELLMFFREVHRVLKKGGVLRTVLVDFDKIVEGYLLDKDSDHFIKNTYLVCKNENFLKRLSFLFFGFRGAKWRYNKMSFKRILEKHGFGNVEILNPGETTIEYHTGINLHERSSNSMYFECKRIVDL